MSFQFSQPRRVQHFIILSTVSAAMGLSACCFEQPSAALAVPPDHECHTGNVNGFGLAIWDCVDGERVVAWREEAEMSCSGVTIERSACGTPTAIEQQLSVEDRAACEGEGEGEGEGE